MTTTQVKSLLDAATLAVHGARMIDYPTAPSDHCNLWVELEAGVVGIAADGTVTFQPSSRLRPEISDPVVDNFGGRHRMVVGSTGACCPGCHGTGRV